MGQIAGSIIASRIIYDLARGIKDVAFAAVDAVAEIQKMTIAIESLMARDVMLGWWNEGIDLTGKYTDALRQVKQPAKEMMDELARLAILSPYSYEYVTTTFRQAMAFGFAADEAKAIKCCSRHRCRQQYA
jgi:hypothetical protein